MKTSARNQFGGTVKAIRGGAVNDEIELDIGGGFGIVATITHESTLDLKLAVGAAATALVKASSVILVTDPGSARFSARNQLAGVVGRVTGGAINSDIVIDLPSGANVVAVVTNESAAALGLAVGQKVTAMFKASNVILAVAA